MTHPADRALVGKQHTETQVSDDDPPGDPDPGDRDPERDHNQMPPQKERDQNPGHIEARPGDLAVSFRNGEVRADAQEKDRGTHGIDNGEERYQGNANPGEKLGKFCHAINDPEGMECCRGKPWQYSPAGGCCQWQHRGRGTHVRRMPQGTGEEASASAFLRITGIVAL